MNNFKKHLAVLSLLFLSACFDSEKELIGADASLKLFGDKGVALVSNDIDKEDRRVGYQWQDNRYVVTNADDTQENYRIADFVDGKYLVQASSKEGFVAYTYATLKENIFTVYAADCVKFPEDQMKKFGLTLSKDNTCRVKDLDTLKKILQEVMKQKPDVLKTYKIMQDQ